MNVSDTTVHFSVNELLNDIFLSILSFYRQLWMLAVAE